MTQDFIRVPITIKELVEVDQIDLDYSTVYRPESSSPLTETSILYLEDEHIEFDDETDEEIFPPFVLENALEYYFNGDIAYDIISNTKYQLENPSIQDFLTNFNYYSMRDCFYTFT